jgi:5-(carboxyamino)imidazole ribonucleotide mutase
VSILFWLFTSGRNNAELSQNGLSCVYSLGYTRAFPAQAGYFEIAETIMSDAKIGIIMGSQSDWPTMKHAADILEELGVAHEVKIVSAHRTPDRMYDYARAAKDRGLKAIIAGAGGAAHLPGMTAALTAVPVLGVPIQSKALSGQDSLLSIVQMPAGIPVGTLAIGDAGAKNAALLAAAIVANEDAALADRLEKWRTARTADVKEIPRDG